MFLRNEFLILTLIRDDFTNLDSSVLFFQCKMQRMFSFFKDA